MAPTLWAAEYESEERFELTTFAPDELEDLRRLGFVVRCRGMGRLDDGVEFVWLRIISADGSYHDHDFMHERAHEDAASFIATMVESATTTLEERLAPFGLEWEREMREGRG